MTEAEFQKKIKEPPYRRDSLQISILRIYTDVNGTIVDKATVPAALQVDFPVYVFGEYDRQGAYNLGLKNTPPASTTFYLCSYVYGINNPFFFGFSGLSDIQGQLEPGDLVTVYTDDLNVPSYYIWIVQRCPDKSLGSILTNLPALPYDPDYGYIRARYFDYYTDNEEQWKENLKLISYNMLGNVKSDGISPYAFKPAITINNQFIQVRVKFRLTQYFGIQFYMLYDTDNITLNFQIEHRLNTIVLN